MSGYYSGMKLAEVLYHCYLSPSLVTSVVCVGGGIGWETSYITVNLLEEAGEKTTHFLPGNLALADIQPSFGHPSASSLRLLGSKHG